jgi:hypothetical protein
VLLLLLLLLLPAVLLPHAWQCMLLTCLQCCQDGCYSIQRLAKQLLPVAGLAGARRVPACKQQKSNTEITPFKLQEQVVPRQTAAPCSWPCRVPAGMCLD